MDMNKVVQCHGANRGAHWSNCGKEADGQKLQQIIREGKEIMYCEDCGEKGPIKPAITFFGEALPVEHMKSIIEII